MYISLFFLKAYKYTKGQVLGASEIGELYEGLKLNHINNFKFILTGK